MKELLRRRSKLKKTKENKHDDAFEQGIWKQSHYYYIHTDEDCENHLQEKKLRYSKCIEKEGRTGRDKDIQGLTGRDKDRQGQTRTSRDRQG